MLTVHVQGLGLFGPGLQGWDNSREVLAGRQALVLGPLQLPPAEALPPAERRRAGLPIRLSMAIGFEAASHARMEPAELPTVFSSTGGDCDNCHAILESLASSDRVVSPTRFHNSVHNAPSGYWGIAARCMAPSTCLCAYDATFAAGLLEAAAQVNAGSSRCLLLSYDTAYPEPLQALRPIPHAMGIGMALTAERQSSGLATLTLALTDAAVDQFEDPTLERLRTRIPTGRALPLMRALALGHEGRIVLEYLAGTNLEVTVSALS